MSSIWKIEFRIKGVDSFSIDKIHNKHVFLQKFVLFIIQFVMQDFEGDWT